MDEQTYEAWWPLHLRAAKGEPLTADEQEFYQAGLRQLHQEEVLHENVESLREMQTKIAQLEAENRRLRAYREQLEARLATLEAASNI